MHGNNSSQNGNRRKNSRTQSQRILRAMAVWGVAVGATGIGVRALAAPPEKAKSPVAKEVGKSAVTLHPLTEDEKIVHVLNRLGFGPRPGDVQKVKAMGLQAYLDQQLTPERIDDTAVQQKLTAYTMLQMSSTQLAELYQARTAAYASSRKLRKKLIAAGTQAGNKADAMPDTMPAEGATPADPATAAKKGKKKLMAMADPQERQEARAAQQALMQTALPIAEAQEQFVDAKVLRAVESERQLQEVLVDFWSNHFNIDIRKQSCGVLKIADDRDVIRPHVLGKFRDLLNASAKSPAMLVYLDNFQSTSDMPQQTRKRPARMKANLKGKLTPASVPDGQAAAGQTGTTPTPPPATPAKKKRGGLNENYAREIMELHTLGVDGGYTQKDVTEVARCFTGWGIGRAGADGMGVKKQAAGGKLAAAGGFQFHPALHDNGEKVVLGQVIPAGGGMQDGEKVLDMLAANPATMRHISTQLCQRLVSDNPPASLVEKCVATWKRTDGDLREVTRTIITSSEFYAPAAYRSKIKSPFEYGVSSIRALGGTCRNDVSPDGKMDGKQRPNLKPPKGGGYLYLNTTTLVGQVGTMGQPLFQYQAPTGYPEESQKWVSSGALISRMNFALALTDGKLSDVSLPNLDQTLAATKDPNQFIDRFAVQVLHGSIAPNTRATLLKQVSAPADGTITNDTTAHRLAALLLGSPEFQRR